MLVLKLQLYKNNMSVKEFALKMNISLPLAYFWLNGKRKIHTDDVKAICNCLNCTPNELFNWEVSNGKRIN